MKKRTELSRLRPVGVMTAATWIVLAFLFAGCGEKQSAQKVDSPEPVQLAKDAASEMKYVDGVFLEVERWGPRKTKRGQGFNLQPSGRSAFWIHVVGKKAGDEFLVTLDGKPLKTTSPPPPAGITASLSPEEANEIIRFSGVYTLAIIDLTTKLRQQVGEFVVE